MAAQPQASSQRRQPVHFFSLRTATPKKSPTFSVSPRLRASKGQIWMQSSQPLPMQLSSMTIALGHSLRGKVRQTSPISSRIDSGGQTTPQAPQSMHSSGSITWMVLRSPEIASVGQRLVQAVQPMQVSMIVYGTDGLSFL